MKAYRAEIDRLSKQYVDKYHREEMQELRELIRIQDERYRITYGKNAQGRSFAQNKEAAPWQQYSFGHKRIQNYRKAVRPKKGQQ